jgi:MtN3 and saliva related transmembrane protein
MNSFSLLGFIAAFFTTISFLPQVIKIYKTKNTEGISPLMYIIFICGIILWIVYSILIKDLAMFAGNIITLSSTIPVLYWVIKNNVIARHRQETSISSQNQAKNELRNAHN